MCGGQLDPGLEKFRAGGQAKRTVLGWNENLKRLVSRREASFALPSSNSVRQRAIHPWRASTEIRSTGSTTSTAPLRSGGSRL